MRHFYLLAVLSCFFSFSTLAQVSFQLGPNGSILSNTFGEDVAFYHESTYPVNDQVGEWNFKLGPLHFGRTVNINEQGQYTDAFTYFGEDAQVFVNTEFEYNEAGQVQLVTEKFIYSEQPMRIRYEWKAKATVPTNATIEMNGDVTQKITYDSRKRGTWEESVLSVKNNERITVERTNNRIQVYRFYQGDGNLRERHLLTYNEEGLVNQTTIYDTKEEVVGQILFSYLYDERGNWLKRLQHDKRTGQYSLTQREIGYVDQLAEAAEHHPIIGLWHSVNQPMKLIIDADGTIALFELGEDMITSGTWTDNGRGQAELKMEKSNRIRFKNLFQQGWKFIATLEPGRLIMQCDGRHYEFVADWFAPAPAGMMMALKHAQWQETLWDKPGHRDPEAIPAGLRQGFTNIQAAAPNRFLACVADSLCGIIDENGYPIIPFAYDYLTFAFPAHYLVNKGEKQGLLDTFGQQVLPIEYDAIWPERNFGTSIFGTRKAGKRYYYNTSKATFWPYEKEDMMAFNDDRWVVRNGSYWLLTNQAFEPIVMADNYYTLKILSPNRYLATTAQRTYQIIDVNGQLITDILGFKNLRREVLGYLSGQSRENNLYALFDNNGQKLTQASYESLQFCASRKQGGELCDDLNMKNALAKYRKPNGEAGYLSGFGKEVE